MSTSTVEHEVASAEDESRRTKYRWINTPAPERSLRLVRLRAGVSIDAAAAHLGMGSSWLRKVERGERPLTVTVAMRLTIFYAAALA